MSKPTPSDYRWWYKKLDALPIPKDKPEADALMHALIVALYNHARGYGETSAVMLHIFQELLNGYRTDPKTKCTHGDTDAPTA